MSQTLVEIAANAAIYPWADRIIEKDTAFSAGSVLPCSGVKVAKKSLGSTLVAIALWSLRESGAAALEPFEQKVLLVKRRQLRVRALGRGGLGAVESGLIGVCDPGDPQKNGVESLIVRWLGERSDPFGAAINRAAGDLAAAGYGHVGGVGLIDQFKGEAMFTPDCARLPALQPVADQALARWAAFGAAEPALQKELLERAKSGLNRCRPISEHGSNSDGPDFD